jgi:hypothetical protein
MIKKYIPTIALIGGGLLLFRWLKGKKEAGQNLKYEPIKVTIDTPRSAANNFYRIYYSVTLRLVNDYPNSVNVKALNLEASTNGRALGTLTSTTEFIVPAMNSKTIELTASISTAGIISTVIDAIRDGFNVPINIAGFITTDLGRLNVNFNKNLGF